MEDTSENFNGGYHCGVWMGDRKLDFSLLLFVYSLEYEVSVYVLMKRHPEIDIRGFCVQFAQLHVQAVVCL